MFYLDWTYEIEEEALAAQDVRIVVPQTRDEALAALPDADVVVVHDGPFGHEQMALLKPDVAGLVCYSVGMNQVTLADAAERGIPVRNLPNWATESVADHTITMLLAAQRHVVELDRQSRGTDWDVRRLMKGLGLQDLPQPDAGDHRGGPDRQAGRPEGARDRLQDGRQRPLHRDLGRSGSAAPPAPRDARAPSTRSRSAARSTRPARSC